jgi:crossover junction endodeoxyribonuclease RuvC
MNVTKILGVDPGTNVLGYSIIEVQDDHIKLLDIGVIKLDRKSDHQTRLKEIFLQLQEVIETYLPQVMAIEAPFFGKNVQSMLKLGRAQGVAMAAAMTMGLEIAEYSPKKIKKAVTGNGNAAKEQVAAMLSHLIKKEVKHASLDATDALATAYCHYLKISGAQLNAQKQHRNWASFLKENPGRVK